MLNIHHTRFGGLFAPVLCLSNKWEENERKLSTESYRAEEKDTRHQLAFRDVITEWYKWQRTSINGDNSIGPIRPICPMCIVPCYDVYMSLVHWSISWDKNPCQVCFWRWTKPHQFTHSRWAGKKSDTTMACRVWWIFIIKYCDRALTHTSTSHSPVEAVGELFYWFQKIFVPWTRKGQKLKPHFIWHHSSFYWYNSRVRYGEMCLQVTSQCL